MIPGGGHKALLAWLTWVIVFALWNSNLYAQVALPDSVLSHADSSRVDTNANQKSKIKGIHAVVADTTEHSILVSDAGNDDAHGDSTVKDTSRSKISRFLGSIHLSPPRERYDAKIAVRRSLILPGWGQLYNRRPWKVPIIYAGFGVFAFFIIDNHRGYLDYDKAVKCVGFPGTCSPNPYYVLGQTYGVQGLINIREGFRRYRDLNFIIAGLWYTLQAVDAYVDAHMRGFNVSEDLSLDIHPSVGIDPFRQNSLYTGMSVSLKLRK